MRQSKWSSRSSNRTIYVNELFLAGNLNVWTLGRWRTCKVWCCTLPTWSCQQRASEHFVRGGAAVGTLHCVYQPVWHQSSVTGKPIHSNLFSLKLLYNYAPIEEIDAERGNPVVMLDPCSNVCSAWACHCSTIDSEAFVILYPNK